MFNYIINWNKIIKENIPLFLQQVFRLAWITSLISGVQKIYSDFLDIKDEFFYKVRFNGQIMYLERILNDKFDTGLRRIYIDDGPVKSFFIYRVSESRPSRYVYRKWNSTITYATNEYAVEANKVYKALHSNTNSQPSLNPTNWQYYKDVNFIWHQPEFLLNYNFIVYAPASLSTQQPAMKAQINYYKLGGRTYQIILF